MTPSPMNWKLRAIGYVAAPAVRQRPQADWLHINAIAYNAELIKSW